MKLKKTILNMKNLSKSSLKKVQAIIAILKTYLKKIIKKFFSSNLAFFASGIMGNKYFADNKEIIKNTMLSNMLSMFIWFILSYNFN
jgi:hypothetical protein